MNKARGKILGTFLFILLILFFAYLLSVPKTVSKRTISGIEISGSKFLLADEYLRQTKLSELENYDHLTLPFIKDRLEKHPYIDAADVEQKDDKVIAYIKEKKMIAIIVKETDLYFVSDDFEILSLIPDTKLVDLPVISNPGLRQLKSNRFTSNENIVEAFKIISAIELTNEKMLKRLSEINLRDGGDIILTFTTFPIPVIFGRGEEARKMVYLESLLLSNELKDLTLNSSYIDLRFNGNIFIGTI